MRLKKEKKLSVEQVKQLVEEINRYNGNLVEIYKIRWITHLWELPGEYYQVRYEDGMYDFFKRDPQSKKLLGVLRTTYFAPHWTNDSRHGLPAALEQELEKRQQEDL